MKALSPADILRVWEEGDARHPLDRALLPLAAALPNWTWSELASLSIGRRDGLLLRLRELTLGARLEMLASCPHCRELMEFDADAGELSVADPLREPRPIPDPLRRLDSHDLAHAVAASRPTARGALAARSAGLAIAPPDAVVAELSAALAKSDPQADILFSLTCPACGHAWSAVFDIADYFWRELSGLARRLLDEVQELAAFYGWREADVVEMSAVRRRHYLERART
jgi:hypothetical protein